jgi:adenylylsulfate kinase
MKILIMGLPNSGKTTLAKELTQQLRDNGKTVTWFNADAIRETYNDWDFSLEGRLRQAQRMNSLASISDSDFCICDFVAPLSQMRTIFDADYTIWVDTIKAGRFADTNKLFEPPLTVDQQIPTQDAVFWAGYIIKDLMIKLYL